MSCVVSSNWLEYAVILKASLLMWGVGLLSYQVYVCFYDAFWCTICCLCRFVRWSVAKISDVSCFAFTQWFYHTLFTMAPLLSLYFIVFSVLLVFRMFTLYCSLLSFSFCCTFQRCKFIMYHNSRLLMFPNFCYCCNQPQDVFMCMLHGTLVVVCGSRTSQLLFTFLEHTQFIYLLSALLVT